MSVLRKNTKVLSFNSRSVLNKLTEIETLAIEEEPDLILITETWTNENISNAEVTLPGYRVLSRKDRSDTKAGRGGGLIAYCKEELNCSEIEVPGMKQVIGLRTSHAEIYLVYRSPNAQEEENEEINKFLEERQEKCVIMGDFNYPLINWSDFSSKCQREQSFVTSLSYAGMTQLVNAPTHKQGNVLDLVLTNDTELVGKVEVDETNAVSDHHLIKLTLQGASQQAKVDVPIPDVANANYQAMRDDLQTIEWHFEIMSRPVQVAWEFLKCKIKDSAAQNTNVKKKRVKKWPFWMNLNVMRIIRKKKRLYDYYKRTGALDAYEKHRAQCKLVKKEVAQAQKSFEESLSKSGFNPRQFYSYMRSKSKTKEAIPRLVKNDGSVVESDEEKCKVLNGFFASVFSKDDPSLKISSPISSDGSPDKTVPSLAHVSFDPNLVAKMINKLRPHSAPGPDGIHPRVLKETVDIISYPLALLFNKSMQEGVIPSDWRRANVSPIYKKGCKMTAGNYRPVSLTSVVCRVMEGVIKEELVNFLEKNHLLSRGQHGFRANRSCVTNLLEYLEKVTELIDRGQSCDIVFFDFKKAFDMVSHKKLILKLDRIGIKSGLCLWIEEWLNQREQQVVLNGSESDWTKVLSGVPQGSVLGPILFLIYINDIAENVPGLLSLFADDTKCFAEVKKEDLTHTIQRSIDALHAWSKEWSMEFNPSKCSVIHLGSNNPNHLYTLNGTIVRASQEEKDVGVIVQDDLKHEKHCEKVSLTCHRIMGQIWRSFKNKDKEIMMKLYQTYILPHLDYGAVVWAPYLKKDINKIETIQRKYTRMIKGMKGLSYEERLSVLGLPTLENRRRKQDLIQTYRIINNIDQVFPIPFKFVKDTNARVTRSSLKMDMVIQKCNSDIRRNFFSVRVAKDWNTLPIEVQTAKSANVFKKEIEKLFDIT